MSFRYDAPGSRSGGLYARDLMPLISIASIVISGAPGVAAVPGMGSNATRLTESYAFASSPNSANSASGWLTMKRRGASRGPTRPSPMRSE